MERASQPGRERKEGNGGRNAGSRETTEVEGGRGGTLNITKAGGYREI